MRGKRERERDDRKEREIERERERDDGKERKRMIDRPGLELESPLGKGSFPLE